MAVDNTDWQRASATVMAEIRSMQAASVQSHQQLGVDAK